MIKLTGELAEETQEILNDLHEGIDVGRKIITTTHSLENKLLGLDLIFSHISFNYDQPVIDFFWEIQEEVEELVEFLKTEEKHGLHIIAQEQAAEKRGKKWILKHREIIEEEIKQEKEIDIAIVKKIHQTFLKIKEFIDQKQIFAKHHNKAAELNHIIQKIFHFFSTYEHLFRRYLKELKE